MNRNQKLELLWAEFNSAWDKYLLDYARRIESIEDINKLIDTFEKDTEESKAIQRKIMEQGSATENELKNQNYELTLKPYLKLAERLGNKDNYPIIKERFKIFKQNIQTISKFHESLDLKLNAFMQIHFK
ncbi:MAG: hypothetical protein WCR55_14710 [Lentisphaerota bacterium]